MDRQSVTIHYRRLDDVPAAFGGSTLEEAIRRAMQKQLNDGTLSQHWKQRAWSVPPDGDDTILMNLFHDGGRYFFGDLTLYSAGRMQALIERIEDAPSLDVEQEPPPAGKEYVNSLMYWFVAQDHVFVIPSRALGAGQLERYLSWLLNEKTQVIEATGHVILKAEFDAADIGGDLDDIREIIVGNATPVLPQAASRALQTDQYHKLTSKSSWSERAVNVLRSVMNNEADVRRLLRSFPLRLSSEFPFTSDIMIEGGR